MLNKREVVTLIANPLSFSGVVSGDPLCSPQKVTALGARAMVIDISISGVAHTGTQTITLQDRTDASGSWNTVKSDTFTGNGVVTLRLLDTVAGDQSVLPLRSQIRLIYTSTDAADEATIDYIHIVQADN